MKIPIIEHTTCTWELDGDTFFCTHDERVILDYTEDHMGLMGHYQTESQGYACAECFEPLEGNPEEDRAEALAESQLMDLLDK